MSSTSSNKKQRTTSNESSSTSLTSHTTNVTAAANLKRCAAALKTLQKNTQAYAFLQPVDWKALELPDYPKIVKNPMDLGTVEIKLKKAAYQTVANFKQDVNQVWQNAYIFNQEDSAIYEAAAALESEFASLMADIDDAARLAEPRAAGGGSSAKSSGFGADELAKCKAALKEIKKKDIASPFLQPVDWKGLGLLDYPQVIKRPMDLGTVSDRLDAGHYNSVRQVAADVALVMNNAMSYNIDGSWIYENASKLKGQAEKLFAHMLQGAAADDEAPTELTFEMKHQLNQNATYLNSKDLYGMVGVVEESCKKALDQTNPNTIEIDIDSLDLPTFVKLEKYVQDCLHRARRKPRLG